MLNEMLIVPADQAQEALRQSAHTILTHATILHASHSELVPSTSNVRVKPSDLVELVASIRAMGLLQNLVCFAQTLDGEQTGRWEVAAGNRRWQAIGLLIAEGSLPADFQIPFLLITEAEAVLMSLAENLHAPMHPADLFDGMLTLAKQGRTADEIGWMFGLTTKTVRQRLKLANVAPRLFALYRQDKASYEQMAALAVSDDHQAQQAAWDSLDNWTRHPQRLRQLLTQHCVAIKSDPVVRYVGLKAYEAAGGKVVRDLFSAQDEGYIEDAPLLEALARTKLDTAALRLKRDHWAWIEVVVRSDPALISTLSWMRMVASAGTPAQQSALAAFDAKSVALQAQMDAIVDSGDQEALQQAASDLAALDVERGQLRSKLREPDPQDRAIAGAVVTIDEEGKLCILRGAIRPQDRPKKAGKVPEPERGSNGAAGTAPSRPVHSERLTMLLTAQRTLALRAELVRQPEVAVLVLAQQLISAVFYAGGDSHTVQLILQVPELPDHARKGPAWDYLEQQRVALAASLPTEEDGTALLDWLRTQTRERIDEYTAFCVAAIVNGVQSREHEVEAVEKLAQAVSLDMHAWWLPTVENYFAHVNKRRTLEVVAQAVAPESAVPLEGMRKDAAAEAAARALSGSTWLPEVLRGQPPVAMMAD